MFGFLSMAMQTGGALAPVLVVPIQMRYGWRASFYVFAVIGAAWAIFWSVWYRNTPAEKHGVSKAEIAEMADGAKVSDHNMPWLTAMRSTNFWAILGVGMCYGYGSYFFVAWLHTYLVRARGFNEKELVWSMLPFAFGGISNLASGWTSDFLLQHYGLKVARRGVGMSGLACGCLFALLATASHSKVGTLLALSMCFAGISFHQVTSFPVSIDVAKKTPGAMCGAQNMSAQTGAFLSGIVFGYAVKVFASYEAGLFVLAGVLGLGTLLWCRVDPTECVTGTN